jgi:hypothetical protein
MLLFIPGHLLPEGAQLRVPGSGGQFPIKSESPVLNAEAQLEDPRQPALFGHGVLLPELTKMETTFFLIIKRILEVTRLIALGHPVGGTWRRAAVSSGRHIKYNEQKTIP